MLFPSGIFILVFLPITLAGFYLMREKMPVRALVTWLVIASFIFYGWWRPAYLLLLIASILANYGGAWLIQSTDGARRKAVLTIGIILNLSLIGVFKYFDFAISTINNVSGSDLALQNIILPLAISFFTFQQIAFLVDIHQRKASLPDLLNYSLFVSFFPQLIAGPIVHHGEMVPQFSKLKAARDIWQDLAVGITIFIIGLCKKIVIADQMATYSTRVFELAETGTPIGLIAGWQAALAYTVQIYFDFSGYSDMAIGLALMFGLRLPMNFASPYRAVSIMDFWRRWHITLSRFLRDYLYYPLGGNRKGTGRRYANLMIVMFLGGLWHGAGWTYIAWGSLHGAYLVIAHLWQSVTSFRMPRVIAWSLTMAAIIIAWVTFRAESFDGAVNVYTGMLGLNGVETPVDMIDKSRTIFISLALIVFCALAPNTQQLFRAFKPVVDEKIEDIPFAPLRRLQWTPTWWRATLFGCMAFVALVLSWVTSEFLYFQF